MFSFSFIFLASKHFSLKPIQTKTLSLSLSLLLHPCRPSNPRYQNHNQNKKKKKKKKKMNPPNSEQESRQERSREAWEAKARQEAAVASRVQSLSMEDPLADNYSDVPILDLQSKVAPGTRV